MNTLNLVKNYGHKFHGFKFSKQFRLKMFQNNHVSLSYSLLDLFFSYLSLSQYLFLLNTCYPFFCIGGVYRLYLRLEGCCFTYSCDNTLIR